MIRTLKQAGSYWIEDQASQLGAALAYYSLFSVTPMLVIALAIVGQVYDSEQAKGELLSQIEGLSDKKGRQAVESMLNNFRAVPHEPRAMVIGVVSILFGAFGLFTALRSALLRIWRLPALPSQGWLVGLIKNYLLALVMVMTASAFVLLLLTCTAALPTLLAEQVRDLPGDGLIVSGGIFLASTILLGLMFAFTFRFMSDGRIRYRRLWGGAFLGAILFSIGKLGIARYLSFSHLETAYGVAGSMVVFLVWIYYSTQIFFFGAEVVRVAIEKDGLPGR